MYQCTIRAKNELLFVNIEVCGKKKQKEEGKVNDTPSSYFGRSVPYTICDIPHRTFFATPYVATYIT